MGLGSPLRAVWDDNHNHGGNTTMSELIIRAACADTRWQLLTTVSALALLTVVVADAKAEDVDRPTVWIELGGQLERMDGVNGRFIEPFMLVTPTPGILNAASPIDAQRPPRYGIGGEAKISFEPKGMDWVFSAAVRYGRGNGNRSVYHQSPGAPFPYKTILYGASKERTPLLEDYSNNRIESSESHAILDFTAGKDVGLGMFGRGGSSTLDFGVRFAQFISKSSADIRVRPDITGAQTGVLKYRYKFHNYALTGHGSRSFHGIGPSLSWNASMPLIGNSNTAEFTFDWGVNAAALFGRQKAKVDHQTTALIYNHAYNHPTPGNGATHYNPFYHHSADKARARSVIVPNVGGFAGMSIKFPNAKVSLGYRADFFFGAMDTGIDTTNRTTTSFRGPYATISIGLGG